MALISKLSQVFVLTILSFSHLIFGNSPQTIQLSIDPNIRYQTVEGFGASDAWNVDFVGRYWSNPEKSKMAEKLFSQTFDSEGNPLGIGLSIWRFNIGAGSAAQGESSQIRNPHRRSESFLQTNGNYDWEKQAGQQWFLKQANEYEVETLVAFTNSPPVSMTRNGIAHGNSGYKANIAKEDYRHFASFLCNVTQHFAEMGIHFDQISPINEPQYEWKTTKQEGSPWTNNEIYEMVRHLDQELENRNLETKILFPEAADWRNLYQTKGQEIHSHQLQAFFSPSSQTYLGDLTRVDKRFAVHSYWTNQSEATILESRSQSFEIAQALGVQLHQTEYSLIALDRIQHNKPSNNWEVAQFIAKIIHYDLTQANVGSWSFWTSMAYQNNDLNRYILIRLLPKNGEDLTSGGTHQATKTLYAIGNYSRFIRPGYQRIKTRLPSVRNSQGEKSLLISAFIAPDNSETVYVLSNLSEDKISVELNNPNDTNPIDKKLYLTNQTSNLKRHDALLTKDTITLPPQSIVTVVETF